MKGFSRSKNAPWIVPHRTDLASIAPEEVLARLAPLGGAAFVRHQGRWIVTADPVETVEGGDVWEALRAPIASTGESPSMAGGWIGLIGYEAGAALEGILPAHVDLNGPPSEVLSRYAAVVVIDDRGGVTLESVDRTAGNRIVDALDHPESLPSATARRTGMPASSLPHDAYLAAVAAVRELIRSGDCYQVNLVQRLVAEWSDGPLKFARALWGDVPGSYRSYLDLSGGTLISTSPELLVRTERIQGGVRAISSPIKGTAHPGHGEALATSPKDLSEHVMIVDLIRNDLGRVAVAGGVSVPRMKYTIETAYADHMVSDIWADLRPGTSPADLLQALVPGGSVTGCPKIRAMEVIRQLEPVPRGPAFGSVVAVGNDGSLDASVLIRTAWLASNEVRYWCGGAVVWDSDPEAEWREAWLKATPFLRALGMAE